MPTTLIRGVRAADSTGESLCDLLVSDGKILSAGPALKAHADCIVNGSGMALLPGLFDMHVHFRDPGQTHKETLETGCAAAIAGGVTGVLCMPNTVPPMDDPEQIRAFLARAEALPVDVHQTGTLTKGMKGESLADYAAMKAAGVTALSDDGRPVPTAALMEQALLAAKAAGLPVVSHCEDLAIINGGIINKGKVSEALGVRGMDRLSEDSVTERDLSLACKTGAQLHICHVSTRGAVDAVRRAKAAGGNVTCETAPHYFMLTEELLMQRDADYRMNPPLRTEDDRQAVIEGILDGTIDCIITDHAPHTAEEKADFLTAPNGVVGLETSLAATLTALYHTDRLTLPQIVRLMCANPRRILHLPTRTLQTGAPADFILVDLNREWTVEPAKLHSKSHNTVFKGMTLKGRVMQVFVAGACVFTAER